MATHALATKGLFAFFFAHITSHIPHVLGLRLEFFKVVRVLLGVLANVASQAGREVADMRVGARRQDRAARFLVDTLLQRTTVSFFF
jgi:hypothetical protein